MHIIHAIVISVHIIHIIIIIVTILTIKDWSYHHVLSLEDRSVELDPASEVTVRDQMT